MRNLNDSGSGSFRDAVAKANAVVIFDVGGSVHLKSTVAVASNITLEGQTAPGEGICLCDYEVSFAGAENDIVRYLRFRVGTETHQDHKYSVGMRGAKQMIFDHCSIEWGGWDCIGMSDGDNITIQYCIIGPGVDPQRFGCLCESDHVTFSHNLWISNKSRNPKAKGLIQYVNNVVYNWGVCGLVGGHSLRDHQLDVINNCFIKGPDSGDRFTGEYFASDKVYQSGNLVDLSRSGKLQGRAAVAADFAPAVMATALRMIPAATVTIDSAVEAYAKVVASAGASLHRDAVDEKLIADVQSLGTKGQLIESPAAGGFSGDLPVASVADDSMRHLLENSKEHPDDYSPAERYANGFVHSGR